MATKKAAKKKATTRKRTTSKAGSEVLVKKAAAEPAGAAKALAPLESLEKMFDDLLERRWPRPPRWDLPRLGDLSGMFEKSVPSVDVIDRAKEVLVRAQVPGIEREDLDVSVVGKTLTIKGSSRHEAKEEGEDYFRQEIRSGAFSRSVALPADVSATKAKATFKDGLLELHLPKVRPSTRQKIALK